MARSVSILIGVLTVLMGGEAAAISLEDVLSMDLVVHFVDVGVGDGILIKLPEAEHEILIDGGDKRRGYSFWDYVEDYVEDPVELAIITHSDYDHWSGIERFMTQGHQINEIWEAGYDRGCKFTGAHAADKKRKDQFLKFIRSLKRKGVPLKQPVPVDPLRPLFELDGVKLWVLHADPKPPEGECSYMINDASVVTRLQYKGVIFLFTGDANGKEREERAEVEPTHVEAKLLDLESKHPGILKAHVLKVPHHGSETASTTKFVQTVAPRFAVISSTSTPQYHLPARRVLQQYQRARFDRRKTIEKVLTTDQGEGSYEKHQFGDDHIICATNGDPADLICDYIWNFTP